MKNKSWVSTLSLLLLLSSSPLFGQGYPIPKMAVRIPATQDRETRWVMGNTTGDAKSLLMELVPSGQSVDSWDELISSTVCFSCSLEEFVGEWRRGLEESGARIESSETLPDGSIITVYKSLEENGIWRHLRGRDGVYGVSYQTRPATENPERVRMWENLIRSVSLDRNPNLAPSAEELENTPTQ